LRIHCPRSKSSGTDSRRRRSKRTQPEMWFVEFVQRRQRITLAGARTFVSTGGVVMMKRSFGVWILLSGCVAGGGDGRTGGGGGGDGAPDTADGDTGDTGTPAEAVVVPVCSDGEHTTPQAGVDAAPDGAVVERRQDASNPIEYGGPEIAAWQQETLQAVGRRPA